MSRDDRVAVNVCVDDVALQGNRAGVGSSMGLPNRSGRGVGAGSQWRILGGFERHAPALGAMPSSGSMVFSMLYHAPDGISKARVYLGGLAWGTASSRDGQAENDAIIRQSWRLPTLAHTALLAPQRPANVSAPAY